jgi:hypothetical protein
MELLFWGWWGLLGGNAGWLANPLSVYGGVSIALGNWNTARVAAGIALLCACHGFVVKVYYFDEGSSTPVTGFGPAVYVWLASLALQLVLVLVGGNPVI